MAEHDPGKHRNFGSNFRRDMIKRKRKQEQSGRPMSGFRYRNRFKAPQGDHPTWIKVLAGDYTGLDNRPTPYFDYFEHFWKKKMAGTICSKIHKELPDGDLDEGSGRCIGCFLKDEGEGISKRRLSAFMILHLDDHYLVPAKDREGNLRKYERDTEYHQAGDQIYNRVWVETPEEELNKMKLKRRDLRRCDKVFGCLKHWSLGTNHLLQLSAKIGELQRECKCGGEITTLTHECPNCNNVVFDLTPEGECEFTRQEVSEIVLEPYDCPHCRETVMLVPFNECDNCDEPESLTLWDVDIQVSRQGTGTSSQLVVGRHRISDLSQEVEDLIPKRDLLHRVFAGDSLQHQAKQFKVDNPWGNSDREAARRRVQERDQEDEQPVDDDDIPF